MNTTENNKKLAEFLGWEVKHYSTPICDIVTPFGQLTETQLKFHNDWNWIMLVAEKIEQTETKDGRTFTIDLHKDNVIINQYGKYNNEIIVTEGGTRIENLYKACIEFVEWYNKE